MSQRRSSEIGWNFASARAQGSRPGSGISVHDASNANQKPLSYLTDPATQSVFPSVMSSEISAPTTSSSASIARQQYSVYDHVSNMSRSSSIWSTNSVFTTPITNESGPDWTEQSRPKRNSQSWQDVPAAAAWHVSDLSYDTSEGSIKSKGKNYNQRKPSNRDEFDGPHQLLDMPSPSTFAAAEKELPHLATNLFVDEQDQILYQVNDRLSKCAFDFVAKYQFPIPLESDKRPVRVPADREWTEWVYLLKRLATKRRIPARVLYNGQIKQLITILENSLEMRHAAKHQSRPLKDDRNVLQLISAGLQVAKILKDADAMEYLDQLYTKTETMIQMRKNNPGYIA